MKQPKAVKAWALVWRSLNEKAHLRIYASAYHANVEWIDGDKIIPVLITPIVKKTRKAKGKKR